MARPFYIPNDDDHQEQQGASQPPSGSSSATQSPLQSPLIVNNEHLVHAFCEALYRMGGGTPAFPLPPPSPSCSPHANMQNATPTGYYGEIFFPRSVSTPRTPRTYTHQPLEEVHRVPMHFSDQQRLPIRRIRLTSTGEDEDDCPSDQESNLDEFQEHFHHMEARERLREFPGRIPQRKKGRSHPSAPATEPETPKDKPKEQCFNWSLVTALFIVVGCGIFASR